MAFQRALIQSAGLLQQLPVGDSIAQQQTSTVSVASASQILTHNIVTLSAGRVALNTNVRLTNTAAATNAYLQIRDSVGGTILQTTTIAPSSFATVDLGSLTTLTVYAQGDSCSVTLVANFI